MSGERNWQRTYEACYVKLDSYRKGNLDKRQIVYSSSTLVECWSNRDGRAGHCKINRTMTIDSGNKGRKSNPQFENED